MLSLMLTPILQTLVWLLLPDLGRAVSISAWYTGLGAPQLAMYDNTTGKLFYSLCNSNSTPVFPGDDTAVLKLYIPPRKNTVIAGTGYQTEGHNVVAIHYIAEAGGIVQALFHCDDTGHYVTDPDQAWIVSNGVDPAIKPMNSTGLAALVLGETGGYRIYYQEDEMVSVLQYTRSSTTGEGSWSYGYPVENEYSVSGNIQAGFTNSDRITVVSTPSRDDNGILVCTSRDHDWLMESFPSGVYEHTGLHYERPTNKTAVSDLQYGSSNKPLSAFDNINTRTGLALGTADTRIIFYIGNDSSLHQYETKEDIDEDYTSGDWEPSKSSPSPNDTSLWPRADKPNAEFAVAYDSDLDKIWLYYIANNGSMTQVHQSSAGVWVPAVALPKFNATAADDPPPTTSPSSEPGEGEGEGGLSGSGKIGVGVGIGIGVPLLVIAVAYAFWHARRSRRQKLEAADDDLAVTATGAAEAAAVAESPAPQYTSGYWGDGGAGAGPGAGAGGAGLGYWANGQWVQPPADLQQQQQQLYAAAGGSKPDGQWQAMDPRFSQMYVGGGSPPPPVHEMAHQEPAYEVAGDGQVSEMPGSQELAITTTPVPAAAPAPALSPSPSPSQQQGAVSLMPDVKAQAK